MKASNKEMYSLGYGYNLPPKSYIKVPKMNSIPGYGKKLKSAPVYGGDQYGVTLQKSRPAIPFNNHVPAFAGNSFIGTQKGEGK